MRVAVVGAGAVGGFYGARLAGAGEEVTFLARGAHLGAMMEGGLTLKTSTAEQKREDRLAVRAVSDPGKVGKVDLALLCVKAHDVPGAARSLPPLLGPDSVVLALQNGVDHPGAISGAVGEGKVLVGSVQRLATQLVGPGTVEHTGGEGEIVFGEVEGEPTGRVREIGGVFSRANIPNRPSGEMRKVLWEKFLFINGVGSVTALARAPVGALLASSRGRRLLEDSCEEIVAVAREEGVDLGGGATERAIGLAETMPEGWRSSMARDLERGRRPEVEAMSGAVVRRAEGYGLPAPVHRTILACLSLRRTEDAPGQEG